MIRLEHVYFKYDDQVVFANLNATILAGLNIVVGGEGSGKTSLLRLLAKQLPMQGGLVSSGTALDGDYSVYFADPKSDAFDQISAADYFETLTTNYPEFDQNMARDIAVSLGLESHLAKPMYMLSTGSKRKVWIAAGFASRAQLTLIDEPYAALDGPSSRMLTELFIEASQHKTRAWLIADYQLPRAVTAIDLACVIDLG